MPKYPLIWTSRKESGHACRIHQDVWKYNRVSGDVKANIRVADKRGGIRPDEGEGSGKRF